MDLLRVGDALALESDPVHRTHGLELVLTIKSVAGLVVVVWTTAQSLVGQLDFARLHPAAIAVGHPIFATNWRVIRGAIDLQVAILILRHLALAVVQLLDVGLSESANI